MRLNAVHLPALGVGVTYSSAIEPLLERYPALVDVIEVEPQTMWIETRDSSEPYRVSDSLLEHIAQLPGRKIVHSVGTPVGGTMRPEPVQLALLWHTITKLDAPWASDHLSFNSTPEFRTGFFLPPRQTPEGVNTVATAIRDLKEALPVPIAVETGVNYLRMRRDEMADGAFVAAAVETADCGLLLDLHNIFANAMNGRQSVEEFVEQIPLERVWEIHLAGGFEMEGFWLDAHSGAIPAPLFEVAQRIVPLLPNLKAIIFEIFPAFIPVVGIETVRTQVERLHELWALRGKTGNTDGNAAFVKPIRYQDPVEMPEYASPATWERALGGLVIGRSLEGQTAQELTADPGVHVINRLISEFRASMIVSVLRLTSRLMLLALGQDVFRVILKDFWSKIPPQQFASTEAEKFADYLEALDLKVPQLGKVLEFERAVMATLIDEQPRIVVFDSDPLPLLRALAQGQLPDAPGQPGRFEIEITPDGPISVSGLSLEALQKVFPFH